MNFGFWYVNRNNVAKKFEYENEKYNDYEYQYLVNIFVFCCYEKFKLLNNTIGDYIQWDHTFETNYKLFLAISKSENLITL